MSERTSRRWWAAGLAAFAVAGLFVVLVGLRALPEQAVTPTAGSADAGFARDMAVHHQQAVEMSFLVRDRTDDEAVRRLAYDIINTQANQRGMLLGMLDAWELPKVSQKPPMAWMGHTTHKGGEHGAMMPGMATDAELDALRSAEGEAAEVLYLQLMTKHHRAGVDMARAGAERADNEQVAHLADGMVSGQRSEIRLMADMLGERGAGEG